MASLENEKTPSTITASAIMVTPTGWRIDQAASPPLLDDSFCTVSVLR
jgi:hypothetical protein